jgi:pyruvate dehydrogenase E2 component (dihydrolipoamide acetyltransferase)
VKGTGPSGRIQGDDVRAFSQHPTPRPQNPTQDPGLRTQDPTHHSSPITHHSLPGRLVPLGKKRRITAERMSLSARTVARLTMNTEIDASEMARLRTRLMPVHEKESGVRLSYNDLLVKAVATALREHPYLNARWTDEGIFLVDQVNVGVAVAVDDGLVVPVVRDADRQKLAEISIELAALVARAREDRLSLQDMAGGTFTITNLGMFGIDSFTPIVNHPEAAILGVGRIVEKPVGRNGEIVLRPMMELSLSFDHRIVDGAPAARFLQRVQQLLEEPYLLI